ncbi:hypothetical protein ACWIG3_32225 [Streptomyces celluloflavus]
MSTTPKTTTSTTTTGDASAAEPRITVSPGVWPLPGTDDQTLHVRIHQAPDCHTVRLAWPTNPTSPHLAPTPQPTPSAGWCVEGDGPGNLTARPTPQAPETPADKDSLHLQLTGFQAGSVPGPLPLTVTVETGPNDSTKSTATEHLIYLDDPNTNPQITNYQAKDVQVAHGGTTTLSWTFPRTDGAFYLVQAPNPDSKGTAAEQKITPKRANDLYTWDTGPLTQDTAFALRWEGKINETDHRTALALTLVMVAKGDIKAGTLTADGTVTVFGTPQNLKLASKAPFAYTPAPTDGIVLADLRFGSATGTAVAKIQVQPPTGQAITAAVTASSTTTEAQTQIPVPAGSTLRVHDITAKAILQMFWVPFGLDSKNTLTLTTGQK